MYDRASHVLTGGVASSYQLRDPWPIYLERGDGPRVWDVDGNETVRLPQRLRVDGPGPRAPGDRQGDRASATPGHALRRPDRGRDRRRRGARAALGPADSGATRTPARSRRWTRSASRAPTPAATRSMKIFGSYHGHHDDGDGLASGSSTTRSATASTSPRCPTARASRRRSSTMYDRGAFNDAECDGAPDRAASTREGRKPACVIMEPAMMNLGVVLPEPGYLEAVREITRTHGIVLIFDEVKTGLCIAAGGATERFGVMPDMVTLAKALGGGMPVGAIGGSDEVMVGRRGRRGLPGRHLQRQPARAWPPRARTSSEVLTPDGLRAPRPPQRPHPRRLHRRHRALQPARATRSASARRAA